MDPLEKEWNNLELDEEKTPSSMSPLSSDQYSDPYVEADYPLMFPPTWSSELLPETGFAFDAAPPKDDYLQQTSAQEPFQFLPPQPMNNTGCPSGPSSDYCYNNSSDNNSSGSSPASSSFVSSGTSSPSQPSTAAGPTLRDFISTHLTPPAPVGKKPAQVNVKIEVPATDPEKKRRGRKKRIKVEDEDTDVSAVELPREKLLALSSNDLDRLSKEFQTQRPLSAKEQEALRKQRRLIKNRESAAQSRQRKKDLMQKLQEDIEQLKREKIDLSNMVERLRRENQLLRSQTQNASYTLGKGPSPILQNGDQLKQFGSSGAQQVSTTNNAKRTGFTLLIFLFSFALLFASPFQTRPSPAFPKIVREPMPDITLNSIKASLNELPLSMSANPFVFLNKKNEENLQGRRRDEEEQQDDEDLPEEDVQLLGVPADQFLSSLFSKTGQELNQLSAPMDLTPDDDLVPAFQQDNSVSRFSQPCCSSEQLLPLSISDLDE